MATCENPGCVNEVTVGRLRYCSVKCRRSAQNKRYQKGHGGLARAVTLEREIESLRGQLVEAKREIEQMRSLLPKKPTLSNVFKAS